jgi:hypothetical protein
MWLYERLAEHLLDEINAVNESTLLQRRKNVQRKVKASALTGFRCGDLCGTGGLYLLVKEDGNWKVQETLMVWKSYNE